MSSGDAPRWRREVLGVVPYRPRRAEPARRERSRLVVVMVLLVMASLVLGLVNLGVFVLLSGSVRLAAIAGQLALAVVFLALLTSRRRG